jgi:hypothetical protein
MLNFKRGIPIAFIEGGKRDKQVIYLDNNNKGGETDVTKFMYEGGYLPGYKGKLSGGIDDYRKYVEHMGMEFTPQMRDDYIEAETMLKEQEGKEILINDGELFLHPTIDPVDDRDTIFIAGATGSGKTRFALRFMEKFIDHHDMDGIIITSTADDYSLKDASEDIEILDGEECTPDKLDISMLEESITYFDDIFEIENPEAKNNVLEINRLSIKKGRHKVINVITSSHFLKDYSRTKLPLSDSKYLVCFPANGSKNQIADVLKSNLQIRNPKMLSKILGLNSQWVVIRQKTPMCVLYEHGVFVIE